MGQEVADTTKREIANAINRIAPQAEVYPLPDSDKLIITLHVKASRYEKPFPMQHVELFNYENLTLKTVENLFLLVSR